MKGQGDLELKTTNKVRINCKRLGKLEVVPLVSCSNTSFRLCGVKLNDRLSNPYLVEKDFAKIKAFLEGEEKWERDNSK